MNTETQHDEQVLRQELALAREKLAALVADRHAVDGELEDIAAERARFDAVRQVCNGLDRLRELGASELFWGEKLSDGRSDDYVRRVRGRLEAFQAQVDEIERRRDAIDAAIRQSHEALEYVEEDLFQAQEAEERRKLEWIVERELDELPARQSVMPWMRGGEDDRRFRKSMAVSLLVSFLLGLIIPRIDLPLPETWTVDEVPERLARLIKEEGALPPPVSTLEDLRAKEPEPEPEPEPQTEPEVQELKPVEGPALAETKPDPRPPAPKTEEKPAEPKGILAFREKFAGLADKAPGARLGADARIASSGGATAIGRPERSMVTTQGPGSSGGINLASLSRDVGGGGGGAMSGVQVTKATSSIGGNGPADRPLAGGPGSSRTDEEIQIVFDRHKAALYRLYNRELRKNPTLKGQMVLKIRIEPDGRVTLCELQATDMNAPVLADDVLARVRTFDFGAKDGIPPVVIVYPIDFLPAA